MHGLIIVPFYFIGTLAALPMLIVIARLCRLPVAINTLVASAIVLTLAAIVIPLALHWTSAAAFTGRPMLLLLVVSFLFAGIDAGLAEYLPLPLDRELQDL